MLFEGTRLPGVLFGSGTELAGHAIVHPFRDPSRVPREKLAARDINFRRVILAIFQRHENVRPTVAVNNI